MSRAARARLGVSAGGGLTSAGLWLWFGLPVALVVAGVMVTAYFLLISDVDPPGPPGERRRL